MNCIIINSEFSLREELKYCINTFSDIEVLKQFENGIEALKYIKNNKVDIIFLTKIVIIISMFTVHDIILHFMYE